MFAMMGLRYLPIEHCKRNALLMAVCAQLVLAACASGPEDGEAPAPYSIELGPSLPPRVVLAPGDQVDVKFFYAPELNELAATVRPDGAITVQLVGDVMVQGSTPAEVRERLRELFAPHLRNPEVSVSVVSLVNRRVYVSGQVHAPGMIEMPGRLTALEAIAQAGGFISETAEPRNVVVIRHREGQRYGCALDLQPSLEGELQQSFFLEAYDIVYVPRNTITEVTNWIDQHINRIIPLGFVFTRETGDSTIGISTGGASVSVGGR